MAPDVMGGLLKLPEDERVDLSMALWASLEESSRVAAFELMPDQPAELERRLQEHVGQLRFVAFQRYRLGITNDEGWYRGQCRSSKLAPRWGGEFYEVKGDVRLTKCPDDWVTLGRGQTSFRHFLFYFKDETFECDASEWTFEVTVAEPSAGSDGG